MCVPEPQVSVAGLYWDPLNEQVAGKGSIVGGRSDPSGDAGVSVIGASSSSASCSSSVSSGTSGEEGVSSFSSGAGVSSLSSGEGAAAGPVAGPAADAATGAASLSLAASRASRAAMRAARAAVSVFGGGSLADGVFVHDTEHVANARWAFGEPVRILPAPVNRAQAAPSRS